LFGLSQAASAQGLRGTVLDSASRRPIPGAVLLLLDSEGQQRARNITNERGEYRVALPFDASRLRVLRLGFRPRDFSIPASTGGVVQLDVLLAAIPRLLEPVVTLANPLCPRRSDHEAAFALWQQARTGLLATNRCT
jgi:hypothetical protein